MPELTRRRHNDPQRQGWDVYYGDVRVGHIGERAGVPKIVDQWGWTCGFYPGCDPGEQQHGIGATFEDARAGSMRLGSECCQRKPRRTLRCGGTSATRTPGNAECGTRSAGCRANARTASPIASAANQSPTARFQSTSGKPTAGSVTTRIRCDDGLLLAENDPYRHPQLRKAARSAAHGPTLLVVPHRDQLNRRNVPDGHSSDLFGGLR